MRRAEEDSTEHQQKVSMKGKETEEEWNRFTRSIRKETCY